MIVAVPLLALLAQSQPVDTTRKTTLPAVSVEAEALKPARYNATTKFDEFYRRKALGKGTFFTREDLERSARTEAAYVLQGVSGTRVYAPVHLPGRNTAPIIRMPRCPPRGLVLFINGMPSGTAMTTAEMLFDIHVNDIEAMEFYTGQSQLPVEAVGLGCAAVFIWTRYTSGSVLKDRNAPKIQAPQEREWPQHARQRPQPPIVTPPALTLPVPAPDGAVVLFDGTSLANWRKKDSDAPAGWKVENGYMEIVPGTGDIAHTMGFGDQQLHVEFMIPPKRGGIDQDAGNSGVWLMGHYEVQVLDSYENVTYPDGQNAALYGDVPPAVNASLPPEQWQSFDITFRAPRFDSNGKLLSPARMTVYHNGVKVHDNVALKGRTTHFKAQTYEPHADRLPISLQDHSHPVRYRNIWVKELK